MSESGPRPQPAQAAPLLNDDWDALDGGKFAPEAQAAAPLAAATGMDGAARAAAHADAVDLVRQARALRRGRGVMEHFLQEFGLSNREGLALMCLAESLLRTPDADTADALIAQAVASGDWGSHLGESESWLVNASTWGLILTGGLVDIDAGARRNPGGFVRGLAARLGEPVIRAAMMQAMRLMGEQFVLGRTIGEALTRSRRIADETGTLFSYDMLGEGARTDSDARRYFDRYCAAVEAVGTARPGGPGEAVDGVSVKLSALHPRYAAEKAETAARELYPRLRAIAEIAARHDLNLCVDAEEADRLVLSLKLFEALAREEALAGWNGLGLAVQAYQKRSASVIARIAALGRETGRRFPVRLVKGAYWDAEIKHAQMRGFPGYPVWTTKQATDISYLACARAMLDAPDAIYPQFATHNAHTVAAVLAMAREGAPEGAPLEFQRLHGMGRPLFAALAARGSAAPVRVYAPVGSHEDLLPYLVRRLLENGANTSFVHTFLDDDIAPEIAARDPFAGSDDLQPHPAIPAPPDLYGARRRNSAGLDLSQAAVRRDLRAASAALESIAAGPIVSGQAGKGAGEAAFSPADLSRQIGTVVTAAPEDIARAKAAAAKAQPDWDRRGGPARAEILRAMADALEAAGPRLIALMAAEAGKTLADGIAEVREAADFCRYYAAEAEARFGAPERLPGPAGETNHLGLAGRGVMGCISPWNFPLAIFTGQCAAALAAGNTVLAKPAEQTPLTAHAAVRLFLEAGLPPDVLHLLPGTGETVGAALSADPGLDGIVFTGSVAAAQAINRALAARDGALGVLVAETGGMNAMFADTTALREQLIDDAVTSAFYSAGQRCSCLRVLFLPEETAGGLIDGLAGAMDALVLGDPADPATDIGPIIDADARRTLQDHVARMARDQRLIRQIDPGPLAESGLFFGPALVEIESLDALAGEVFGPVMHVIRYRPGRLEAAARALAARNYGLTLGVHSRLDGFAAAVRAAVPAGNVYVNRNMVGAVVGVQPFGGEGLSGTGPKAGGPLMLPRLAVERTLTVNVAAQGGDPDLLNLS